VTPPSPQPGDVLETIIVEHIDPWPMKVMAALYDDPNPIHFDLETTQALGRGDRLVYQGAAGIALMLEPAIRLAGHPEAVRSYDVRLLGNIYAEDRVETGGKVLGVDLTANTATLDLFARVGGADVIRGTAVLAL
jgi:hypothetical protein